MRYFGTNLTEHGHYWWDVEENNLSNSKIYVDPLPFDTYDLMDPGCEDKRHKGNVVFKNFKGISVLAIEGSCKDTRWGTFSIFMLDEEITKEEMICRIGDFPILQRIISQMPFEVNIDKELLES